MLTQQQISKRQNLAASAFVAVVVLDVIVRVLKYVGLVNGLMSWYIVPVGVISLVGYCTLYSIASNSIAEIFAVCQGVIVAFFSLLATFVIYTETGASYNVYTPVLLVMCMGFVLFSMYLCVVMFGSEKFTPGQLRWVVLIPMPYVGDVCRYFCWLQNYVENSSYLSDWEMGNPLSPLLAWFVLVVSAVGYWQLCHSRPYSGVYDDFSMPRWSPFNRYFLAYAVAIIAVFLIY